MTRGRFSRLAPYLALLLLVLLRYQAFLRGGVLAFRDAGFFFVPWRTVTARLLAHGAFPAWNEWASAGRALAADPNAALFWPLTPLLVLASPTALSLLNAALAVLAMTLAARWAGLSPLAAAGAGAFLLFSGVFQTLPLLFTSIASAAPLPLALVAAVRLARNEGRSGRNAAAVALALGLSVLGGEPAIAAIGGTGALLVFLFAGGRARGAARLAAAGALAAGIAAVQILPTAALLSRSVRGRTARAEEAALLFSTRPARLLTLLEPRLSGDPLAESDEEFWGAATLDAGGAYFTDVALGLVPLLLALAGLAAPRARPFVLAAAAGALLSLGRFLPGGAALFGELGVFRYPEKWWLLVTLGLALGAAAALDEAKAHRRLAVPALGAAALLGLPALLAAAAPGALRALLWGTGLGAGPARASVVSGLLLPRLALGALSALLLALLARAAAAGRVRADFVPAAALGLFALDAGVRVAGTLPAGPPGLYANAPADVRAVLAMQGKGRFYDDGADRRDVAVARAARSGGLDPLRPLTGAVFGVRYAGENDIDRMTPRASFAFAATTAALPWGPEKVRRLRLAGVTVARRPRGEGSDVLESIAGSRPLFTLVPRAAFVPPGGSLGAGEGSDPLAVAFCESPAPAPARLFAPGTLDRLEEGASFDRLRVESPGGACLAISRSFDPGWRVTVDGAPAPLLPADGPFAALLLPPGRHEVRLAYREPLFAWGALASLVAAALAVLWYSRG